jgi:NAD(P)-dependent dehydrogenase (short-subunit alcohol dehydrogenase family)
MSLENKVAIVTGGERGIGHGITKRFLQQGMRVCMAGLDEEAAEKTLKEFDAGDRLLFIPTDVGEEAAVQAMIEKTVGQFGQLDAVVANAGLADASGQPVESLSLEKWDRIIQTNLTGGFLCAKHAFPELRKTKGSMVLIASTRALQSQRDGIAYSASKGGVLALTHSLAISGGPEIRVNAISPGWISHDDPAELPDRVHAVHPVGRVGRHADIASMAAYLISEEAGFITGQNFVVDGGMTKKMIYKE